MLRDAKNAKPDDLPLSDPYVNKNKRDTPMGTACWALTELTHMVASFAVPIQDGKPLYTNEYIRADGRRAAVENTLERVRDTEKSVLAQLPESAQPFVKDLIAQTSAASTYVSANSDLVTLLQMHKSISMKYLDFSKYHGLEQFGKVASASPGCAL